MANADMFVMSSRSEGMPMAILEAMSFGLPIVATRVGGNAELVEHGVTGQLVMAQDVAVLSDALSSYVRNADLRRLHGAAARRRAVNEFSLERMAAQYAELYFNVVGAATRRANGRMYA